MSFFGGIFGSKKEEPHPQQNHPEPPPATQSGAPAATGGDASMFGGFAQIKTKPHSTSVTKPKGFDPFSMNSGNPFGVKQPPSSNVGGSMPIDQGANPPSGPGSLSKLDEGDVTPGSNQEIVPETSKKSAFGFIKKGTMKPAGTDTQTTSFGANTEAHQNSFYGNQTYTSENPETEINTEAPSMISERKQSLSSNASEPVNVGKGSAFGFLNKKKTNPPPTDAEAQPNMFNQSSTSIKMNASQQDLDEAESKIASTPPSKSLGPAFLKFKQKSPAAETDAAKQNEEQNISNADNKSDHSAGKSSSIQESNKSSGPSFMKFKKTGTTKSQVSEPPQMNESFQSSEQTPVVKNESPKEPTKFFGRFSKPQSEPEQPSISIAKVIKTERVASPTKTVQTPATKEEDDPTNVRLRLEERKGEIIENIGDLIVRQNGLMGKKSSLEDQRDGIAKKLQMVAKQQNEAIERDNFEEADHLEVVIVELNETTRDLIKQIDDCELEYAHLEKEKQMLYQNQHMLYKNIVAKLENIMLTQNYNNEKYKLEIMNQQNVEKSYIEEKTKELQYNRNHIDLDLKHINEETHQIEETMDKQLKDHLGEQKDLSERKTDLEMDIDRIRRELKAKEDELANVTKSLTKVNSKISSIEGKFEDQLNKIKKKRDKVNTEEDKYQEDMTKLLQHKERAENSLKRLEEVIDNFSKQMQSYEEMKTNFIEDSERLDRENSRREHVITIYYESLNGLRQEKQHLLACEEEIDKLKDDLSKYQKEVGDLASQKNTLLNKIPEFEKEKKAFVASRSFKDASRISNEIKEVQNKIAEIEEKTIQLSDKEKSTLHKISTLESETIPDLRHKVDVTLKECDINKYELLKVKEHDLASIHSYYLTQKLFEEANMIETELKTAQKELVQLINQYPELQRRGEEPSEAHIEENNLVQPEEEHKEHLEHIEEEKHEEHEEAVEEHPAIQEADAHNEERKQLSLHELVTEYEDNQTKINDLEDLIGQLASEDKFDEADDATNQQEALKRRQEDIMADINSRGFNDISEAKEAAEREGNEEKPAESQEHDLLGGEETVGEEKGDEQKVEDEKEGNIQNEEKEEEGNEQKEDERNEQKEDEGNEQKEDEGNEQKEEGEGEQEHVIAEENAGVSEEQTETEHKENLLD